MHGHIIATTIVYSAAIPKYHTINVLGLAGNIRMDLKGKRITPHHLQNAICGEEELDTSSRAPSPVAALSRTTTTP